MNALLRNDAQTGIFELGIDLAGQVAFGGVGFDDLGRALDGHLFVSCYILRGELWPGL